MRSLLSKDRWIVVCVLAGLGAPAFAGELTVTSVIPSQNALNVARATDIVVDFDRALSSASPDAENFRVFGKATGPVSGTLQLESGDTRLRFTPAAPFHAGEQVFVNLASDLEAADTSTLRSAGYGFDFRIIAAPATREFTQIDSFSVRTTPSVQARVYGGQAADFDQDGHLDLAAINEVSSDVRIFPSKGDGTGRFDSMLTPTTAVGDTPSPNEPADFDGDGLIDIVTANIDGDSLTVLFGNGDGTFTGRTDYPVGDSPRGLALLDVNGDACTDIVCANSNSGNMALLINDGAGGFAPATFFEGGGSGEWATTAADMNNDGIYDLVVGAFSSQRVLVLLGNGDGTFTQQGLQNGVGNTWMIVCGDLDGDGNVDVTSANGGSSTGSILLGDGNGGLGAPTNLAASGFTTATDIGDLDGDGDLDWVLSAFGGGRWRMFENDGAGAMSFDQDIFAPDNPGCSLLVDIDEDLDLDLILLDEIADLVILMRNEDGPPIGTRFCSPAVPNSTGSGAVMNVRGSTTVSDDSLFLEAIQLPTGTNIGYFIMGTGTNTFVPPGSSGPICIAPGIKRYLPPVNNTLGGSFWRHVGTDGPVSGNVTPGSTWSFQAWHRDGMDPSNLTDAISVTFQ